MTHPLSSVNIRLFFAGILHFIALTLTLAVSLVTPALERTSQKFRSLSDWQWWQATLLAWNTHPVNFFHERQNSHWLVCLIKKKEREDQRQAKHNTIAGNHNDLLMGSIKRFSVCFHLSIDLVLLSRGKDQPSNLRTHAIVISALTNQMQFCSFSMDVVFQRRKLISIQFVPSPSSLSWFLLFFISHT